MTTAPSPTSKRPSSRQRRDRSVGASKAHYEAIGRTLDARADAFHELAAFLRTPRDDAGQLRFPVAPLPGFELCDVREWAERMHLARVSAARARGTESEVRDPDAEVAWLAERATAFHTKLAGCSPRLFMGRCPETGKVHCRGSCCRSAACPREEHRRSARWAKRIITLAETLEVPAGWGHKLVTVSLRQRGGMFERVDRAIRLRASALRRLRDEYGVSDAVATIDTGEHGNVHVHIECVAPFIARDRELRWLQAQDCTVPGCTHEPDDRCEECRAAKCSCPHPHADGTPRCNGSFVFDVRSVRARCPGCKRRPNAAGVCRCEGKVHDLRSAENLIGGIFEAVKYATSPALPDGRPAEERQWFARMTALLHLALRGRHRIETYGRYRAPMPEEERASTDTADGDERPWLCTCCEVPVAIRCVGVGVRERGLGFRWSATATGPPSVSERVAEHFRRKDRLHHQH